MQHIHTHTHTPTGRRWQIEASKLLDRFPAPSPNVTENSLLLLLLLLALLLFLLFPPILYRRCCIHTPSYNVGKRKLENSFFFILFLFSFKGSSSRRMSFKKERKKERLFQYPSVSLCSCWSCLAACWLHVDSVDRWLLNWFHSLSLFLSVFCLVFLTLLVIFRAQKQSLNVRCCVCLGSDLRNERVIQSSIQRKRKKKTLEKESRIRENMKGFLCVC